MEFNFAKSSVGRNIQDLALVSLALVSPSNDDGFPNVPSVVIVSHLCQFLVGEAGRSAYLYARHKCHRPFVKAYVRDRNVALDF